jgi:hypothetical protein
VAVAAVAAVVLVAVGAATAGSTAVEPSCVHADAATVCTVPDVTVTETATETVTATTTETVTETVTATPTPTPTQTPTTPPTSARPGPGNTGVPAGVQLTDSGSLTITRAGTVVDGLHVRGTITVQAANVTIRNTLVQSATSAYPIRVTAPGVLIEDTEVDNLGGTGIGILFSTGSDGGTVRRADVWNGEDGIRIQANRITVEASYLHDLQRAPGGHHDTVQIRSGDNVTLRGNTLLPYKASTGETMNAALQIGSLSGADQISNLRVVGNWMDGGNFTVNGGGRHEVDSAIYSGNRFGRHAKYGVAGNLNNSVWDVTNVFDDNGTPAR